MTDTHNTFRLYGDLAWLWPIWGDPTVEYAEYCEYVVRLMLKHARRPIRSLLDIGCGGGKNVFNLKRHYEVTGLDLSPAMLKLARELNPECEFVQGDMRTFSLGRTFDAILMDDAISHMASQADLGAAFRAAFRHLSPGGVMVATADEATETFVQNRTTVTPATGKGRPANIDVVFVENDYDPDPGDSCYEKVIIYAIRKDGKLRVETDHHTLGLFPLHVWRDTLTSAGFEIHEGIYTDGATEYVTWACVKAM